MKTLAFALALAATTTFTAFAQDTTTVVAKVGDREITSGDLDQATTDMAQQFASFPEAERRARALDSLIDINVLAIEAQKSGLADDETVKRRLALLRDRALHNFYFEKNVQSAITDADVKARYDKEMAEAKPDQEVQARHILVKTKEEADAIVAELEGGADFETLAKEKSTGPSGPKGGDLGFFGKGRMVPEFEKAAFAMKDGEYTKEPVQTQFGFHVIQRVGSRDVPLPTLEQAGEQLRQLLLTERYAKTIEEGRASVGVELLDTSLALPDSDTKPAEGESKEEVDATETAPATPNAEPAKPETDEEKSN